MPQEDRSTATLEPKDPSRPTGLAPTSAKDLRDYLDEKLDLPKENLGAGKGKRAMSSTENEEPRPRKLLKNNESTWDKKELDMTYTKYEGYMRGEDLELREQLQRLIPIMKEEDKALTTILERVQQEQKEVTRAWWPSMKRLASKLSLEVILDLVKAACAEWEKEKEKCERLKERERKVLDWDWDAGSGIGDVEVDDEMMTGGYVDMEEGMVDATGREWSANEETEGMEGTEETDDDTEEWEDCLKS